MLDVWKESLSSKFNKNCVQREVWLVSDLVFLSATINRIVKTKQKSLSLLLLLLQLHRIMSLNKKKQLEKKKEQLWILWLHEHISWANRELTEREFKQNIIVVFIIVILFIFLLVVIATAGRHFLDQLETTGKGFGAAGRLCWNQKCILQHFLTGQ